MVKKITFKEDNNAAMMCYENGDININPKLVAKFGYIDSSVNNNGEVFLQPKEFVFDCRGEADAIKIEKRSNIIEFS